MNTYNKLVKLLDSIELTKEFSIIRATTERNIIIVTLPMHAKGFICIEINDINYHCECGHYNADDIEEIDETYDALYAHEVVEWLTQKI